MKYLRYFVFLLLLLIPFNVKAANICTANKYNALKAKAFKIELSYELKFDEKHNPYFEITVMNMTEDLILKFNSTIYEAKENGTFVINTKLQGGNTYKFNFYGGYNNACVEQFIYSKSLTLPRYNIFSEREECIEYEDFPLCRKWYSKEIGSETEFLDALEEYKKTLEKKEPIDLDTDEKGLFDKLIEFYQNNLIITLPITLAIVGGALYYVARKVIKKKKRVKIRDDEFKL